MNEVVVAWKGRGRIGEALEQVLGLVAAGALLVEHGR